MEKFGSEVGEEGAAGGVEKVARRKEFQKTCPNEAFKSRLSHS